MTPQFATVAVDGHLTIVTLNRPELLNALHNEANLELESIFDAFEADDSQWVAIITGAGDKAFCAGNDLKATAAKGVLISDDLAKTGFAGLTNRKGMTKPVIAAVNGLAMGGGFEIALACDLIIASENAIFALPEPLVGLLAAGGGLVRLPRQIGEKRAMGMILTGRRVGASEGQALGFVHEVVPVGEALAAAKRQASLILNAAPMSIRAAKAVVRVAEELSVDDALAAQFEVPAVRAMLASEDAIEGPRAFAEKRAPAWKNR